MQPLLLLAALLIGLIVLVAVAIALMNAFKIDEPWRTVILAIVVIGCLVFVSRQIGVF